MTGFDVVTESLRASAAQAMTNGANVATAGGSVTAQVQAGTAVNPGYATSAALDAFASQLGTSMSNCGQAISAHARALSANADAYDGVEAENVNLFKPS